jgi:SAM-dependent methyltransferase
MSSESEEYKKANLALWNEWAEIHARSEFYDVEGMRAGKISLKSFEMEELGDVAGKSLLHLQCHFGLDTMSWARLGAKATGVDFSDRAIELAHGLNEELGLDAEFVCADVYELPAVLKGHFDILYTSSGVLAWLPDLRAWAEVIAHFLKPGGVFYMAEFHPTAYMFDDSEDATELRIAYPYFGSREPLMLEVKGSYADREAQVEQKVTYEWAHGLGEIITALTTAGLRLEFLHEFPFSVYPMFPSLMELSEDGLWRLKDEELSVPLMFSVKARKD